MVPLCLNEFVLLKSCQVESEQQKLQDLNQEHTQNLLVSDYAAYSRLCSVNFHTIDVPWEDFLWNDPGEPNNRQGEASFIGETGKSLSRMLLIENTLARKNGDVSKYC